MPLPLVYHPDYSFAFPARHRFPMEKFGLLYEHVKSLGIASTHNVYRPGACPTRFLTLAHCPDYVRRFIKGELTPKELRRLGLPWSEALVKRTCISPMGTVLTAQLALENGIACHLAGGTHHAFYDAASGFCIFNDLAIAAKALVQKSRVNRVLIFDCDVHQGDGTASILQDDPNVMTCSLHCEKNFPVKKAKSDWDVGLPKGMSDEAYLAEVRQQLEYCLTTFQPDMVLYDAGVDIYQDDPLGLLSVSEAGIRQRDAFVIETCLQKKIPIATVIGGGYDDDRLALAKRHGLVVEEADRLYREYQIT